MSSDQFTPEQRSWIMSRVKGKNTTPEIILRKELWRRGLRYRIKAENLPGKPDILFPKVKVVVFVDGAFWHGKKLSSTRLGQMSAYWQKKIKSNVDRDIQNNEKLKNMGYLVLRFMDNEIVKNTVGISVQVESAVANRRKHRTGLKN